MIYGALNLILCLQTCPKERARWYHSAKILVQFKDEIGSIDHFGPIDQNSLLAVQSELGQRQAQATQIQTHRANFPQNQSHPQIGKEIFDVRFSKTQ